MRGFSALPWADIMWTVIGSIYAVSTVSYIFGLRGPLVFFNGFLGGVCWFVYCICMDFHIDLFFSTVISTTCTAMGAQIGARIFKAPVTIMQTPSLYPLVPGLLVYRATIAFISGDHPTASMYAEQTVITACGIALGILFVEAFFIVNRGIRFRYRRGRRILWKRHHP